MNLFFVSSPFQLLCAMEAVEHYRCENNVLVLREQENALAESHALQILDESQWAHIIRLPKKPSAFSIPRMPDLLKRIGRVNRRMRFDKIFYAEYSSWRMAVILANLECNAEIMFDDGTATIFEYENRILPEKVIRFDRARKERTLRMFGFRGARDVFPRAHFSMFTMFDLEASGVHVERTRFQYIKTRFGLNNVYEESGDIVFIGDGATNRGLNLEAYADNIKTLTKQGRRIVYFPHRNEIREVKAMLSESALIEYADNSLPVELQIQKLGHGVSSIYGFYSSALFSLHNLYPDVPIYTRSLTNEEAGAAATLLGETVSYAERYLTGSNVRRWL